MSEEWGPEPGPDGRPRCWWCLGAEDLLAYHDGEWGRELHGEVALYERLTLEAFQSGLSWLTILRKRENFRLAFDGFDPERVAAYGADDVSRLMADAGIVRNRRKIDAAVTNAQATLALREDGGGLDELIWSFAPEPRPGSAVGPRPAAVHRGVEGARQGAEATGLRVRRPDHDLRADAGRRPRQRSPRRVRLPGATTTLNASVWERASLQGAKGRSHFGEDWRGTAAYVKMPPSVFAGWCGSAENDRLGFTEHSFPVQDETTRRGNYESGADYVLEYGELRFSFNERDFAQRVEQAAVKLDFVRQGLDEHELEDLLELAVNGEIREPCSPLGEHVNDHWDDLVGPSNKSLVHWLRRLVFRGAWLDQRVKEGELDIVFDERTQTFGYVQPDRDSELIELSAEPSWADAAYAGRDRA